MPQQTAAVSHGDDWTGVTDPVARRSVQNRLNQRVYREGPVTPFIDTGALADGRQGHVDEKVAENPKRQIIMTATFH